MTPLETLAFILVGAYAVGTSTFAALRILRHNRRLAELEDRADDIDDELQDVSAVAHECARILQP